MTIFGWIAVTAYLAVCGVALLVGKTSARIVAASMLIVGAVAIGLQKAFGASTVWIAVLDLAPIPLMLWLVRRYDERWLLAVLVLQMLVTGAHIGARFTPGLWAMVYLSVVQVIGYAQLGLLGWATIRSVTAVRSRL